MKRYGLLILSGSSKRCFPFDRTRNIGKSQERGNESSQRGKCVSDLPCRMLHIHLCMDAAFTQLTFVTTMQG